MKPQPPIPKRHERTGAATPAPAAHQPTALEEVPVELIQARILVIRGIRVMLDSDPAAFYGVSTSRFNEAVKRNVDRFPVEDFRFQLTRGETEAIRASRSQSATLKRGQNIKYLPWVFTEHGALMAASILNSPRAVQMSVLVIRAFVQLRQLVVNHKAIAAKLAQLEAREGEHDSQIAALIEAIRFLTTPDMPIHGRQIGYHAG